jgi:hypothetical protein
MMLKIIATLGNLTKDLYNNHYTDCANHEQIHLVEFKQ